MEKPVTKNPEAAPATQKDGRASTPGKTGDGKLDQAVQSWEQKYKGTAKERDDLFETISGDPVQPLYTPLDDRERDYLKDVGFPGEYPYTRGIHPSMYRGRLWTMRQFAGFGNAKQTNERYHYLLEHGQMGLSVAFDVPTLMGLDSDDARSEGEVGVCGVAVDSLADMEVLFDGIPLDKITTSMTVNGPAAIIWALFLAAAEKQGCLLKSSVAHCRTMPSRSS